MLYFVVVYVLLLYMLILNSNSTVQQYDANILTPTKKGELSPMEANIARNRRIVQEQLKRLYAQQYHQSVQ
jgi:hypothetical protein